jgi:parallel beta-helix repeat protein
MKGIADRYTTALLSVIAVLVLAALSAPVMAENLDELETRCWNGNCLNGTITNGTVIVLCNMTGLPTIGNWTITLPDGDVKIAYVHWHRWGACHGTATTAEFWNDDDAYESIGFDYPGEDEEVYEDHGVWFTDYNPRNGNHHYYWKVNATSGDNIFNATGCYPTQGEFCAGRWFFAVIDNVTAEADQTHDGHWWHNTGYEKTTSAVEQYTWYYNASGDPINTAANYTLWTAQSHYYNCFPPIEFNDVEVGKAGDKCGGNRDFSLDKFNVNSTLIDDDGDQKVKWKYAGDPYYVYFGTLAEVLPKPDLVIPDIEPNATTLRANTSYTINATVKNIGSKNVTDTFNLCLSVNGSYYNKTSVSGGLNVSESKTVSFALPVNLTNGCHSFTVVADCDGVIAESDETNNATTEYYQVGYVLVVEGNGGFDDLVTESENGVFGDGNVSKVGGTTYYIQNFTGDYAIENCAGCGISIKDTTAPFVIRNCTVHNCAGKGSTGDSAGICLDNVTKGTIGDSSDTNKIANNTDAGIRVKNSTHVDITDNTIRNNTQYGVYAYPRQLPVTSETCDDCNYINVTNNTVTKNEDGLSLIAHNCTVKNNTITNNTNYGIYFFGNNSNITDCNDIRNNTDYGVKLYNSYDNNIYCNILADNNASNPGHQACDISTATSLPTTTPATRDIRHVMTGITTGTQLTQVRTTQETSGMIGMTTVDIQVRMT